MKNGSKTENTAIVEARRSALTRVRVPKELSGVIVLKGVKYTLKTTKK